MSAVRCLGTSAHSGGVNRRADRYEIGDFEDSKIAVLHHNSHFSAIHNTIKRYSQP